MKLNTAQFIEISVLQDKIKRLENESTVLKTRIIALERKVDRNEGNIEASKIKSERSLIAASNLTQSVKALFEVGNSRFETYEENFEGFYVTIKQIEKALSAKGIIKIRE